MEEKREKIPTRNEVSQEETLVQKCVVGTPDGIVLMPEGGSGSFHSVAPEIVNKIKGG
jgi:hypothetical protein